MKHSPFLEALNCQNKTTEIPVWLMRQAGRYLPEYQTFRKKFSFEEMQKDPEIASIVTLQPIQRFQMDAAIIFSDILVAGDLIGYPFSFKELQGPYLKKRLEKPEDIKKISLRKACDLLQNLKKAIEITKNESPVPLIGFAGAPLTLASYIIEGKSSSDFKLTLKWMEEHPEYFDHLLKILSSAVVDLLKWQADAGCDALQIFDTWAQIVPPSKYKSILKHTNYILEELRPLNKPIILFCKGGINYSREQVELRSQAVSLDASVSLKEARKLFGSKVCLQGNLDPLTLLEPKEIIQENAKKITHEMAHDPGFIFNLGHGVLKETKVEAIYSLLEAIRK